MDEPFEVFGPAYLFVDERLELFLSDRMGVMTAELAPAVRSALVLYVTLYGIAIVRGAITEPVLDFAVRSLKLAIVSLLSTTVAYQTYVTDPLFRGLPNALAAAVGGGGAADIGGAFDQFYARAAFLAENVAQEASWTHFGPWILSAVIYVAAALTAALGFGVTLLAKLALALLIALGPIFIACALFDVTRRFFFGWLAQAINYLVLFALILAVLQLVLGLVAGQWSRIEGGDPVAGGLVFVALCLLAMIFFLQTPTIASGIAGGASAGLADFANAAATSRSYLFTPRRGRR